MLRHPELLTLAIQLDEARLEANRHGATATQWPHGVYGEIAKALANVLILMAGTEGKAMDAYQALLDGNDVETALALAEGNAV